MKTTQLYSCTILKVHSQFNNPSRTNSSKMSHPGICLILVLVDCWTHSILAPAVSLHLLLLLSPLSIPSLSLSLLSFFSLPLPSPSPFFSDLLYSPLKGPL